MEINVQLGKSQAIRQRADEPSLLVNNRFFEANPTNTEDQVALIERPALVKLIEPDGGPGRRLYRQKGFANGDVFHVSGNNLWRHTQSPSRVITSKQIPGVIQGNGAPDMCANDFGHLFITDGYSLQQTDGTSALATIDTSGIGNVAFSTLDVFNGFVLCGVANSNRFYWLWPGSLTFGNLDFATKERFPDNILQIRAVGDEFWLLGESSIEVWRATGDGAAPFQRVEGRAFNFGIFGGTAVRMKDTSVNLVAHDGTVFSIWGLPRSISNPAIAEKTRNAIKSAKGG